MTKYFCRKCSVQMKVKEEPVGMFKRVVKCPKCGTEIIADYKEDLS